MFRRQRTGSVVCPSCGKLVGVNQEKCPYCGRSRPGMWGLTPMLRDLGQDFGFTEVLMWGCGLIYLITLVVDPSHLFGGGILGFLSPTGPTLFLFGESGAHPVFTFGRWWTVLSATWLHGGALHILFNMLWIRDLGRLTTHVYGGGRMMILFTVGGAMGFLASSAVGYWFAFLPGFLQGAPFTVGASASLFGLLGALIYSGRRGGSVALGTQARNWAIVLFVFGLLMPQVDNWAHLGGLVGGYLMGRFLDPAKPERTDHLILGFVCILLSWGAIALSIVTGLPILRQQGIL